MAVIVAEDAALTSRWFMVKVALLAPTLMTTEATTVATFVFELFSLTVSGLPACTPIRDTVPVIVVFDPPTTDEDERLTEPKKAGVTVSTTD